MMKQMTSRTRCGSHSHLSCVTTIEAFVKPMHVWTLFFLVRTLRAGSLQFCFFLRYESVFLVGASPTSFLRPTSRSKIVWRVPHVFLTTIVRNITRFVK